MSIMQYRCHFIERDCRRACTGAGVPPTAITGVIGVSKAYITRVDRVRFQPRCMANGRNDSQGRNEYAPSQDARAAAVVRRTAVALHAAINGFDSLIITKLTCWMSWTKSQVRVLWRLRRNARDYTRPGIDPARIPKDARMKSPTRA